MKEFFFPDRLGRFSFFVRSVLFSFLSYGLIGQIENGEYLVVSLLLLIISTVYAAIGVYLPRIRDCGANRLTLILTFIPYVASVFGLYLLFRPTEFTAIFDSGGSNDLELEDDEITDNG